MSDDKAIDDLKSVFAEHGIEAVVIGHRADAECDLCSKVAELRPYGPKGENICFECAMKDEKTTSHMFKRQFE